MMLPAEPARIDHVRQLVRGLLESTDSFGELPEAERRSVARSLVTILDFLTDGKGGTRRPIASAQAEQQEFAANKKLQDKLTQGGPTAGQDFKAGAARELGATFRDIVGAVDFPKFVSNLIEGVFSSIVRSSIKQMEAFSRMLESVAKSADQFAKETISDQTVRSYLQSSYPHALEIGVGDEGGEQLKLRDGLDDKDVPDFQNDLGLTEQASLDDKEGEAKIILGAQLKMARQRQQHLATMMLMGLNRIIVTDGEIKASVMFDTRSRDKVGRQSQARTSDSHTDVKNRSSGGGWFDDSSESEVETRVSTATAEQSEQSSSELEARAKLSGSVTVKFRSETFPLERFASSEQLGFVTDKGRG
ncbi:MAG TPA: hypothetical protein VFK02_22965 [Kofleriaceae bacterium]|nr:hypothetical protein [Kofleriaceae bacterium]